MIGERWSAQSKAASALSPAAESPPAFMTATSECVSGELHELGLSESPELPVVVLRFAAGAASADQPLDTSSVADAFGRHDTHLRRGGVRCGGGSALALPRSLPRSTRPRKACGPSVVELAAIGGQALTSSIIRIYPGFFPRRQRRQAVSVDLAASLYLRSTTFLFLCARPRACRAVTATTRCVYSDGNRSHLADRWSSRPAPPTGSSAFLTWSTCIASSSSTAPQPARHLAMRGRTVFVAGRGNSALADRAAHSQWAVQVTILVRALDRSRTACPSTSSARSTPHRT